MWYKKKKAANADRHPYAPGKRKWVKSSKKPMIERLLTNGETKTNKKRLNCFTYTALK